MALRIPTWRKLVLRAFRVDVIWTEKAALLAAHPSILVCNHASMIDGVLIALASPVPMAFAVTPTYAVHNPYTRTGLALLTHLGLGRVIPLSQERPSSLRALSRALWNGESVMIFPTGTISPSENKSGYLWLQQKTGATVIRARITGTDRSRLFSLNGRLLWPKIEITI